MRDVCLWHGGGMYNFRLGQQPMQPSVGGRVHADSPAGGTDSGRRRVLE